MTDNDTEDWSQHLTPDLRKRFSVIGPALVENDVKNKNYRKHEKQLAAIQWLYEQRKAETRDKVMRFWIPTGISIAALLISVVALYQTLLGRSG
jgi:hypothetical protein